MYLVSKNLLLVFLVVLPMVSTQLVPLSTKFFTPNYSLSAIYANLAYFTNTSKPITFDANDATVDYDSRTWMDPCYKQYIATKAKILVFWINGKIVTCEPMIAKDTASKQRFPITSLMRVEREGARC